MSEMQNYDWRPWWMQLYVGMDARGEGKAMPTTWRELIGEEMKEHGESWDDAMHTAFVALDTFEREFGGSQGQPFTVWTEARVYFPAVYDGSEWCASVPRNPTSEVMGHIGRE